MDTYLIALAAPVFLSLILGELIWDWRKKNGSYKFQDSLSNLACGMGSQLTGLLITPIAAILYIIVYEQFHIFEMPPTDLSTWAFAMIGVDFCYYWSHRLGHEWNIFWTFHVVHHQSESYNFSVALRQSWFGGLIMWVFYAVLAIAGIPAEIFSAALSINLIYQFVIHTESVGTLGPNSVCITVFVLR